MALLLETDLGDLVIDLDVEGSPALAKNVLKLAKARFYTKTLIHTVTQNRFCQLGCPVGNGTGGSSIYGLLDHNNTTTNGGDGDYCQSSKRFLKSSSAGRYLTPAECQEKGRVVACLAGGGSIPDTIGSQFLITTAEGHDCALDGYTIPSHDDSAESSPAGFLSLGVVAEDENGVLDKINAAYTDRDGRPYADIRILRALVVEDPFEDPPGMVELLSRRGVVLAENDDGSSRVIFSPSPLHPTEETVPARISIKEVDDGQSVEDEEVLHAREEETQRKEDRSRAVVLEMLGDLPSADIKAPENALFICKLNPATQDEDLELIFSRFDPAVKVEIIRDHDTGNSLQYAFAEFRTKKQAEEAYFKMDNALVDDRRIKVDFSQSVSKVWDKYNQKQRMPRGGYGGTFPAEKRQISNDRAQPREQHRKSGHARDEFGGAARVKDDRHGGKHRERGRGSDDRDRDRYHRKRSYEDDGSEREHRNDHRHHRRSPEAHHRHRGHRRHDSSSSESRVCRREYTRYKRSRSNDEKDSHRERKHRDERDLNVTRNDRHNKHDDRHARRHRESSHKDGGSHVSTDRHRRHRDQSEESYRQRKRHKEHKRHDKEHKSRKRSRHYDQEPRGDRHGKEDRKRHHF